MEFKYQKSNHVDDKKSILFILDKKSEINKIDLSKDEKAYVKNCIEDGKEFAEINLYGNWMFFILAKEEKDKSLKLEGYRLLGAAVWTCINDYKINTIQVVGNNKEYALSLAEGIGLKNYAFNKYFKATNKKQFYLKNLVIIAPKLTSNEINNLNITTQAVFHSRDLVNEPLSFLTAPQLAKEIQKLSKDAGFSVEVFGKKKIESLKMGGLIAVNKGSIDPPTFSVLEWKPKSAKNKKPFVLVGKGVVYDTGGVSLKPTANSMDQMKSDMGGAAMMIGTMYAIAKAKLDVHVICLIPATDNRPGLNAYVPGDVVKMHNGLTVEVLNTDAEGRMLLADALSYAKKYKPELVIDAATLTGAAVRSFGSTASCIMGTASDKIFKSLEKSADNVFERVVKQPFWSEYGAGLKSDVADLKNLGGPSAGHISAGKFLEHFVDYPWVHFDIAGTAFINKENGYRPKWGTGTGVRLLFDFFSKN